MKKALIITLLVFGSGLVGGCGDDEGGSGSGGASEAVKIEYSADEGRRHVEADGDFSFIPPDGWKMNEAPGLKYQIAGGEPSDGFAPNINVVDETLSMTLEDYRAQNLLALKRILPKFKLLKTETLMTDQGEKVIKLDCETEPLGQRLRQILYLTANDDRKYVITCSVLKDNSRGYGQLFDAVVKTFRME